MNKLFALPLLTLIGVAVSSNSFDYQLSASDITAVEQINIEHGEDGYDIEVGQEVELDQGQFTYLPSDATDKSVKYKIYNDSYSGDLPPAMFSSNSTYENIIIKGLMVGDFKVYFYAADGGNVFADATFHVYATGELPSNAQKDGYNVVKSAAENNVAPGTTSLYKNGNTGSVKNPTPIYKDGKFDASAIASFLSQIFTINTFVILGIVLIGLLFIYVLIYSFKKIAWKHRR